MQKVEEYGVLALNHLTLNTCAFRTYKWMVATINIQAFDTTNKQTMNKQTNNEQANKQWTNKQTTNKYGTWQICLCCVLQGYWMEIKQLAISGISSLCSLTSAWWTKGHLPSTIKEKEGRVTAIAITEEAGEKNESNSPVSLAFLLTWLRRFGKASRELPSHVWGSGNCWDTLGISSTLWTGNRNKEKMTLPPTRSNRQKTVQKARKQWKSKKMAKNTIDKNGP